MFSGESFRTASLGRLREGQAIARILAASINAVEPGAAVARCFHRSGDILTAGGREYHLADFRSVQLLGIGKAAVPMSLQIASTLGKRLDSGLIISKHAGAAPGTRLTCLTGGHPLPDGSSLEAGKKALDTLAGLTPDDLLICPISGGGSALVATPVDGVTLQDIQALTAALLACGASIDEINLVRRRLERLKGGGLARLSNGATILSLLLSDVIGNRLEAIASGLTAPDPAGRAQAMAVLDRYGLHSQVPASIRATLEHGPETPKPGDPIFARVHNLIVGSNLLAAQAALTQARAEGFNPYLLRVDLQGEAAQAAFELATCLRQARLTGEPAPRPACIVAGGETTVVLHGNGKGGRNTELALAAVTELADFPGVALVTLATDGEDGPTDAAGAVVTGESFRRAAELKLQPDDHLSRNDSYTFFAALDDLLKPGPTGTNVNDLVFLFSL